ncbi:EF-hand domain-containing protein [Caulobacter sp. ErkDOM-YI]|uniref:EF-hand domain-containing protein n=1 Tax=unclassified Caulobacter TaxID=2648921 RepID=UPI003AF8F9A9
MLKITMIAAGSVLLLAGPVLAAPKGAAALDANADGKVSLAEFQAGRGGQMMAHLDADKDGKLSREEFSAMRKPRPDAPDANAGRAGKGAERMWSRVDADTDGFLSRGEMDGFLANRFKRMDADNDGALSLTELKTGADKAKVGI